MTKRRSAVSLWIDLVAVCCFSAVIFSIFWILRDVDGWLAWQSRWQAAGHASERILFVLFVGVVVGSFTTLIALAVRARYDRVLRIILALSMVFIMYVITDALVIWAIRVGWTALPGYEAGMVSLIACAIIIVAATAVPRLRRAVRSATEDSVDTGRRGAITSGIAAATVVVAGHWARRSPVRRGASVGDARNILLVTFDAMSAEDMSCYGYRLPTTPHIDAFARRSAVFDHYYSSCTFTTPSIATMLTGLYPSEAKVYHLGGPLRGEVAKRTAARLLRELGYTTAASVANPFAHPITLGTEEDYEFLPSPPLRPPFDHNFLLRFRGAFDGVDQAANAILEAADDNPFFRWEDSSFFPPHMSFIQAERLLAALPRPYFLWIHVLAPHEPSRPGRPYRRRFLPEEDAYPELDVGWMTSKRGFYPPSMQPYVDKLRLRYDEWIAQADGAFGAFVGRLRRSGELDRTVMIVSADHGQSFQGGFLLHQGPKLLRQILRVPLIIHTPGQTRGWHSAVVADESVLAPTILDLAGLPPAAWMSNKSLLPHALNPTGSGSGEGLAFTQYLEANSVFRPIKKGVVGVIDGSHQCVVDLGTGHTSLYRLADANLQDHDLAREEPAMCASLRERIFARFPDLPDHSA